MDTGIKYCFLLFLPFIFSACAASYQSSENQPQQESRYYTSAHPTRNISARLEQIQHSVKRISSTGIYQTYYFADFYLHQHQLTNLDIAKLATRSITHNRSTAGTAFIVGNNGRNVALLTCAHVVSFPDTLISYVSVGPAKGNTVISSISVKKHQVNLIYDLPDFGNFEIIAQNSLSDLALLSVELRGREDYYAPALPIQIGDPHDLRLGSFVMVMGFPEGFPMVTRGIVSDPNRNDYGAFLTDALFNHGISGGLIIASRDNYKSFEWIGIANSASATTEIQLVPNPLALEVYQPFEPYADTIFVQKKRNITYGITQAIPVTKVIEFLKKHEDKLSRLGIDTKRIVSSRY